MIRARQLFILFFLIVLLGSLFMRLFYLQVLNYERFSGMASEQHNKIIKIEPRRGSIYDRRMEPLALNLDIPSLYCDPRNIKDKELTAELLSAPLKMDKKDLLAKFNKDRSFLWVKRKMDPEIAKQIKKLRLKGIHFLTESKRNYTNNKMASHLIGFAGIDNHGLEGLELLYDKQLTGKPGWNHIVRDAKRRTVLFNEKESIAPENGCSIHLTIDSVMQFIVEQELEKMVLKFNARSASCVVIDPFTGKILAMANYPDYNLNEFYETPREKMKNYAVSGVFEPGSVFKIITASAALNEGIVSLDEKIYCEKGEYKVGGRILHDFHKYGRLTFRDVISKSSNIGTVKIAEKLGKKRLYDYIKKFGFGEKTGIDLPGEVRGISRPPKFWSMSDITTIPIGQGIAVTPLQLACAISVISNGGYLVKPYVVEMVTTWEGNLYKKVIPQKGNYVITEETCEKVKEALAKVITEGTGKRAKSKFYDLCGKTGTAQMVNPSGGYYDNKYYATFIGFAPKDKPMLAIVVSACDPHPVYFGGSVAGPAFKNIAEQILQYAGVPKKNVEKKN